MNDDKSKRDAAIDAFAEAMKQRLDQKAAEGKTGWDGGYPTEFLLNDMARNATVICAIGREQEYYSKLAIDLANRAMMVWYRNANQN